MASLRYLVDTSVFARLPKPSVADAFARLAATGSLGICAPVAFELGYSARSHDDYRALADRLTAFAAVPVSRSVMAGTAASTPIVTPPGGGRYRTPAGQSAVPRSTTHSVAWPVAAPTSSKSAS